MEFKVTRFGAQAVLLDWPPQINEVVHQELLAVDAYLNTHFQKEIIETVVTYHSIAVYLEVDVKVQSFCRQIEDTRAQIRLVNTQRNKRIITLPVCYEDAYGIDLVYLSKLHAVPKSRLIKWHTQAMYRVYFIGFLPGFPYLGGLDERLHTPRRARPRPRLSKGAVGIGGQQTGIYPQHSPGGWHIIGHCPVDLFDAQKEQACLLQAGDIVRFKAIDETMLAAIQATPNYEPEIKILS